MVAMNEKKNVWVDGSLRDYQWYSQVFDTLREKWPAYRIAILYVYADKEVVLQRAAKRAVLTGREVPAEDLIDSIEKVGLIVSYSALLIDKFIERSLFDTVKTP